MHIAMTAKMALNEIFHQAVILFRMTLKPGMQQPTKVVRHRIRRTHDWSIYGQYLAIVIAASNPQWTVEPHPLQSMDSYSFA